MTEAGIDAYIATGSDPHGSEHPPSGWRTREWISGFTGSSGTVVVTAEEAGLWTDFRYWIQATGELPDDLVRLHKDGEPDVLSLQDWLAEVLENGDTVGMDGRTVSLEDAESWEARLSDAGIRMRTDMDLIGDIWTDRPKRGGEPVKELSEDETGESRQTRIHRLKAALSKSGCNTWIGIGLDSIAWLLNIRGRDIPHNPVVLGFLLLDVSGCTWFTDIHRVPDDVVFALGEDGVRLSSYDGFFQAISSLPSESRILADKKNLSRAVSDHIPPDLVIRYAPDPVIAMKARKNPTEASRISRAMEKDGIAMLRFMMDFRRMIEAGESIDELGAADVLREYRSAIPGYLEDSFSSIPAFGAHGAICHYEAKPESAFVIEKGKSLFLLDSGAQWEEGTTDITRTFSLGEPTAQMKRDYTLVLKGHIALSRIQFPRGTRGYQLDTIARSALWAEGLDYGHGTGHGVGYRLNVHEGPQRLSPAPLDVALEPGMVVSNEPGLYREDQYGIRIENLMICRESHTGEFGTFFAFETLTLAPYERELIDSSLLDEAELEWMNTYHAQVYNRLKPMLEEDERTWLAKRIAPIGTPARS
jgi:Xaa-Pro aminopeptidase